MLLHTPVASTPTSTSGVGRGFTETENAMSQNGNDQKANQDHLGDTFIYHENSHDRKSCKVETVHEEIRNILMAIKAKLYNENTDQQNDWNIVFAVVRRLFLVCYVICNIVSFVLFMPRA